MPSATSYGLHHNERRHGSAASPINFSSRGWSRTSGLRVQSATFVPTQTTRATTSQLPRHGSNVDHLVQSQGCYRLHHRASGVSASMRDAGIEPATRHWQGHVMPLHQSRGFCASVVLSPLLHFQARCRNRTGDSSLGGTRDATSPTRRTHENQPKQKAPRSWPGLGALSLKKTVRRSPGPCAQTLITLLLPAVDSGGDGEHRCNEQQPGAGLYSGAGKKTG